nr:hypothetical protein [uncultured Paracoccus sp.]
MNQIEALVGELGQVAGIALVMAELDPVYVRIVEIEFALEVHQRNLDLASQLRCEHPPVFGRSSRIEDSNPPLLRNRPA